MAVPEPSLTSPLVGPLTNAEAARAAAELSELCLRWCVRHLSEQCGPDTGTLRMRAALELATLLRTESSVLSCYCPEGRKLLRKEHHNTSHAALQELVTILRAVVPAYSTLPAAGSSAMQAEDAPMVDAPHDAYAYASRCETSNEAEGGRTPPSAVLSQRAEAPELWACHVLLAEALLELATGGGDGSLDDGVAVVTGTGAEEVVREASAALFAAARVGPPCEAFALVTMARVQATLLSAAPDEPVRTDVTLALSAHGVRAARTRLQQKASAAAEAGDDADEDDESDEGDGKDEEQTGGLGLTPAPDPAARGRWAQCSLCHKWRRLAIDAVAVGDDWHCSLNLDAACKLRGFDATLPSSAPSPAPSSPRRAAIARRLTIV